MSYFHCVFLSFLIQSIVDDVYVSTPVIPSFMQHHEIQEKIFLCFCNRMRPIFQYTWVFKFWLLLNPKVATIYHPLITDPKPLKNLFSSPCWWRMSFNSNCCLPNIDYHCVCSMAVKEFLLKNLFTVGVRKWQYR